MKILVIGGTGNISRWFVPRLLGAGHDVTLFNRGIQRVGQAWDVTRLIGDRTDYATFERQMHDAGTFDCVIDMFGFEPDEADSAVRAFRGRVGQFIFCSTVDVYPKRPMSYPVSERTRISASPSFSYAYKKVEMERRLWHAHAAGAFPLTVIRPAATYSEGRSPLMTCFGAQTYHLDRLLNGQPVILHGDGTAIWVATHSDDVGRAFVNAAGNPKAFGKAYNTTGDELMTWHAMHRVVAQELGAPEPDFVCIPTSVLGILAPIEAEWCVENFQFDNIFDNTAAKADLGFEYTMSYRDGVRRLVAHLRERDLIERSRAFPFYDAVLETWRAMEGMARKRP